MRGDAPAPRRYITDDRLATSAAGRLLPNGFISLGDGTRAKREAARVPARQRDPFWLPMEKGGVSLQADRDRADLFRIAAIDTVFLFVLYGESSCPPPLSPAFLAPSLLAFLLASDPLQLTAWFIPVRGASGIARTSK